jgi:hypothetical protein
MHYRSRTGEWYGNVNNASGAIVSPTRFFQRIRMEKASAQSSDIHIEHFLQRLHCPSARMAGGRAHRRRARDACIAHAKGSRRRSHQPVFDPWAGLVTPEVVPQYLRRSDVVSGPMTSRSRQDPILRRSTHVLWIAHPRGG